MRRKWRMKRLAMKIKRVDKLAVLGYGLATFGAIILFVFLCASTVSMILPVFMIFLGLMMLSAGATILGRKGLLDE